MTKARGPQAEQGGGHGGGLTVFTALHVSAMIPISISVEVTNFVSGQMCKYGLLELWGLSMYQKKTLQKYTFNLED